MNKHFIKPVSLVVMLLMIFSFCIGCNSSKSDTSTSVPEGGTTQAGGGQEGPIASLPMPLVNEPVTLTYWCPFSSNSYQNYGDTPLYKEIQKRTGITLEFQHPPAGQEKEQFNLMVASNDLPDIIETSWLAYPGGPEKAMADKIIIPLNDLMEQYAPNLSKVINGDGEMNKIVNKSMKTDKGIYYMVPLIYLDSFALVWHGPQLRKDWLDELNLQVPTTIDEWYPVLKTLKEKKDATLSFVMGSLKTSNGFIGSFGIGAAFYQEDGKVRFGPAEPGYRDFLTTFAKWYDEGLIDPDFAAQDGKTYDAKILNNKVGAFLGNVGGHMGKYLTSAKESNPQFDLVGAPYPSLKKGEDCLFGQCDPPVLMDYSAGITPGNKYPKESMMFLDYGFTEEGHMLYCFGIENESYKMVDGYPKYTDLITHNPEGLSFGQAADGYMRSHLGGPFVEDSRYFEQYMQYPQQVQAVKEWQKASNSRALPPITPKSEDAQKLATITNEINTYVDEMFLKFIMGQEPLSKFDSYVEAVKKMGIDEALKIQQEALDNFNKR